MKKYYTTVSQQFGKDLANLVYENVGGSPVLNYGVTHFPLIPLIANTAEAGETVRIIVIKPAFDTVEKSFEVFVQEVNALAAEKGFSFEIVPIDISAEETVDVHLDLFGRLCETVADDDQIYIDITYGTKPLPIVQMMFMNFAYRCKQNVSIEYVIYGWVRRDFSVQPPALHGKIFDVTALFYMNSAVNFLENTQNPSEVLRTLLAL